MYRSEIRFLSLSYYQIITLLNFTRNKSSVLYCISDIFVILKEKWKNAGMLRKMHFKNAGAYHS